MMERKLLQSLTQLAIMNGIALSLIGLQSIIPFSFVLFIVLISLVFAVQAYYASGASVLLSGIAFVSGTFLMFGVVPGCWACVYVVFGIGCGALRKARIPYPLRLLGCSITSALLLGLLLWVFAGLAGYQLESLQELPYPVPHFVVAAGVVAALLVATATDLLLSRVLQHLQCLES